MVRKIREWLNRQYKRPSHNYTNYPLENELDFYNQRFETISAINGYNGHEEVFEIEQFYIHERFGKQNDVLMFVGTVENLGWVFFACDIYANNSNILTYSICGKDKNKCYADFQKYKEDTKLYGRDYYESRKFTRKSMKESSSMFTQIMTTISKHDYSDRVYDCVELGKSYVDVICSDKKYANQIADVIMAENTNIICVDFRKTNGGYKFSAMGKATNESKKSVRKSIKEYRTVGLEQEVREKCIEILEDSYEDLFDLGMCSEVVMTYDNRGRAETSSNGDVYIDYLTLPPYAWSSGFTPKNKKLAKMFEEWQEDNYELAKEKTFAMYKDELADLGITDKDDDNLEYNTLYDMGAGDIAERLSEYEYDLEGLDCYTFINCEITDVDDGVELTVSMEVQDEYGHALVRDYKPSKPILIREGDDVEEIVRDTIKSVTEQF